MSVKTAYSALSDILTDEPVMTLTCTITNTTAVCFWIACNTTTTQPPPPPPPKVLDDDELLALHLMVSEQWKIPNSFPPFLSVIAEILELR